MHNATLDARRRDLAKLRTIIAGNTAQRARIGANVALGVGSF